MQNCLNNFVLKESCFKRIINWNKCQTKVSRERINQYLDLLIDPSFQGVNFLFYCLKTKHKEQVTKDITFQLEEQKIIIL